AARRQSFGWWSLVTLQVGALTCDQLRNLSFNIEQRSPSVARPSYFNPQKLDSGGNPRRVNMRFKPSTLRLLHHDHPTYIHSTHKYLSKSVVPVPAGTSSRRGVGLSWLGASLFLSVLYGAAGVLGSPSARMSLKVALSDLHTLVAAVAGSCMLIPHLCHPSIEIQLLGILPRCR